MSLIKNYYKNYGINLCDKCNKKIYCYGSNTMNYHLEFRCITNSINCVKCNDLVNKNLLDIHLMEKCINNMESCPHCNEKYNPGKLSIHIQYECINNKSICSHCEGLFNIGYLGYHEQECIKGGTCELCNMKLSYFHYIYDHLKVCKKNVILCLKCNTEVNLYNMNKHIESECKIIYKQINFTL